MSDQDFFFDEDEAPAKETAPKKAGSSDKAAAKAAPAAGAATAVQTVSMSVAALIGVIALLAGVIIGIVIPVGGGANVPAPTGVQTPGAPGGDSAAPQLSPDQLNSGELPEGHPPIGGGEGGQGAPGGSTETTAK